ncbi:hypothetical protein OG349_12995 [Streptomyces sp. NBC_01317]|uniref:hypothetical protein n=1 Tax=Streptomyces sp. NBC_01317 TaxID=2903822 RepID=UPI002E0F0F37|nr:hypothetical protein OG349_12995 [Streptomyces sp. NBC_01317]
MRSQDSARADREWRAEMLAVIANGSVDQATEALLSLTFNDPDGAWVESVLLDCLDGDFDDQVKLLAVTCFGHLARIHGEICNPRTVMQVKRMTEVPGFEGRAQDALDDFETFL